MIARELIDAIYRTGERRIEVSSDVFRAYSDSLLAMSRAVEDEPVNGYFDRPRWLAFKDAKVVEATS